MKANRIEGRCALVGQLHPYAGIFTCSPRCGAELGEGFVLGYRHIGVAVRLLVPLQVFHSVVDYLVLASRLRNIMLVGIVGFSFPFYFRLYPSCLR